MATDQFQSTVGISCLACTTHTDIRTTKGCELQRFRKVSNNQLTHDLHFIAQKLQENHFKSRQRFFLMRWNPKRRETFMLKPWEERIPEVPENVAMGLTAEERLPPEVDAPWPGWKCYEQVWDEASETLKLGLSR
ncbi:hypothetical protein ElyMa_000666100 [Elysia marginata]|uniref:Uncharacterized protein n=1 Tax=Elysia marginata TaxID=1093978 RepID=A0AAV4GIH2_9GAST|nr:hypothetical protein ElyMa_000666100 [Elysia marginata]